MMKYGKVWLVAVLSLLLLNSDSLQAADHQNQTNRVLVVDQKGNGSFRNVQSAIDAIPVNNQQRVTIYIKNGVYKEKSCFRKINLMCPLSGKTNTRRF